MYDQFNIRCFAPNPLSNVREVPARLVNALIHGLNEKPDTSQFIPFLPRHILVVPDWDIVKYIGHYKYGVTKMTTKVITWIIDNMVQEVEKRKNDLARLKPGAVTLKEPKTILIKMIDRVSCHDKALSVRHKFNTVLEDALTKYDDHYIMDISKHMANSAYFTEQGGMTKDGAIHFWLEVDEILKLFEIHKISLNPIKSSETEQQRFKMPPPPLQPHHQFAQLPREHRDNRSARANPGNHRAPSKNQFHRRSYEQPRNFNNKPWRQHPRIDNHKRNSAKRRLSSFSSSIRNFMNFLLGEICPTS